MNSEDVIRMVREAGGLPDPMVFIGAYERFAALVAAAEREKQAEAFEQILTATRNDTRAAEREACAKVCEEKQEYLMPISCPDGISGCLVAHYIPARREKTGNECAAAIRARGQE